MNWIRGHPWTIGTAVLLAAAVAAIAVNPPSGRTVIWGAAGAFAAAAARLGWRAWRRHG
jgi:hypothetical protein